MTEPSADPAQPHPCPACDQLVTDGRLYCPDHRAVRRPSTGTTQRDQQEKAP